jgi:hypothetical protein
MGIKGNSHNPDPIKVQEDETSHVQRTKFKPHDVGMQVSHRMDTEVLQEGNIRIPQEILGKNISRPGKAKRM